MYTHARLETSEQTYSAVSFSSFLKFSSQNRHFKVRWMDGY